MRISIIRGADQAMTCPCTYYCMVAGTTPLLCSCPTALGIADAVCSSEDDLEH